MPRVSVVIPSYNHGKFIRECIQSVLDQTYQDFEMIITDDGSSDDSVRQIENFKDPRIHLHTFQFNRGACAALNNCIRNASGEFIAFLSSDETWKPQKLMIQTAYLDNNPGIGAVFAKVFWVGDDSALLPPEAVSLYNVFEQENRTRFEWLNFFFFEHNCLCHPGSLVRYRCYKEIGLFNERMASLPDFDMWIRLCFKYDIHILDQKLVNMRISAGNVNASGPNMPNIMRGVFENKQILDHYLSITDTQLFYRIFPEAAKYSPVEKQVIPYLLGLMAISTNERSRQLWGLEVIYKILNDDHVLTDLQCKYGFGHTDFHKLMGCTDVFTLVDLYTRAVKIDELEGVLRSKNTETNELNEALREKEMQIKSSAAEIQEKNSRINVLSADLLEKNSRINGLTTQGQQKDGRIIELDMHLEKIQRGIPAQFIRRYQKAADKILPSGTRSRHLYDLCLTGIRNLLNEGWRSFRRKSSV
jgi:glycosyltransferase involved in cell wall biosynthesis